jgi:hypothetical protein
MSRRQACCAGLIAAVLSGCHGDPTEEDEPYFFTENQMKGAMITDAKERGLLDKARNGEPSTLVVWIDLIKRQCKRHDHEVPINMFMMHNPGSDYIPDNKYTELAYYCMEDQMWYYRYISPDKKSDVLLGPFFVERRPAGGGPDYRRGGPLPHRH